MIVICILLLLLQGCMCYSVLVPLRRGMPASPCLETTTTESCQVKDLVALEHLCSGLMTVKCVGRVTVTEFRYYFMYSDISAVSSKAVITSCICVWLHQAGSPSLSHGPASCHGNSRLLADSTLPASRWRFDPSRDWMSTSPLSCWVSQHWSMRLCFE